MVLTHVLQTAQASVGDGLWADRGIALACAVYALKEWRAWRLGRKYIRAQKAPKYTPEQVEEILRKTFGGNKPPDTE